MRTLKNLVVSIGALAILAALASAAALAQQNVDTVVTHGKILTVDAGFRVVEALAIDDGRIVARGTSAEVARYAGPDTQGHRRRRRDRHPGPHRQPLPLHARRRHLAPAGPLRRRRLAPRSAARFSRPRRRACRPASGSWCRAAGRRGSSPTRRADSRSRSSTAWRRRIRCSCRRAIASSTPTASRSRPSG